MFLKAFTALHYHQHMINLILFDLLLQQSKFPPKRSPSPKFIIHMPHLWSRPNLSTKLDDPLYLYTLSLKWKKMEFGLTIFLKILFIYLRERVRERESTRGGSGRGRSRLPAESRARRGAPSQDSRMMTWAKGRRLTNWATQAPLSTPLLVSF